MRCSGRSAPRPDSAKANILTALEHPCHVVVGTSGPTDDDFAEIDIVARDCQRAVLACGNFALTVVLLQRFAEAAARLIPHWEIVDYAHDDKRDAPSGTARELAARLSKAGTHDDHGTARSDGRTPRRAGRHAGGLTVSLSSACRVM